MIAVSRWLSLAVVYACVSATGCGDDLPERARFVTPLYAPACDDFDCSERGECVLLDAGAPYCECSRGYAGTHCEVCELDFHRDAFWHCVPDRSCEDGRDSACGDHGECKDDAGVIACECAQGYRGARCDLCSAGYVSSQMGTCVKKGSAK